MGDGSDLLMDYHDNNNVNFSDQWKRENNNNYSDKIVWAFNMLTLIFIALGIGGNVLCIKIFAKREMRSTTIYLIFLLLAIANTMSLLLFFLEIFHSWRNRVLCVIYLITEALDYVDSLLIVLASFAHMSRESSFLLCCSDHNRRYLSRTVWYSQPCFVITMSVLVIVFIFNCINISLHCFSISYFKITLARPVMIVFIVALSCIYMSRIIPRTCSTHTTSSDVRNRAKGATLNTSERLDMRSHFDIPLFLLQVCFLLSHIPLMLLEWVYYFASHKIGLTLGNIIYLIYKMHFCGKIIVYASTLRIFRHNLRMLYKKPGLRHHESTRNEADVMTDT